MIPVTHPLPMIYQCLLYSKSCWILLVPGDYPLPFCVTGGDETWRVETVHTLTFMDFPAGPL